MKFGAGKAEYVNGEIKTTDFDNYNAGVKINVDGSEYDPKYELTSATQKAHWTVFKFNLSEMPIPPDGQLNFFIKGIGGGHDVGGYMNVEVPKIDIKGTKEWIGGPTPRQSINLQLKRYLLGSDPNTAQLVDGTTKGVDGNESLNWSYTWKDMQEYSSYGQRYIYYVDEETVPINYEKSINKNHGRIVTNTYRSPKTTITGTKVWVGGPEDKPIIELQLYRNGTLVEGSAKSLAHPNLTVEWTDMDKTDGNGVVYQYTVDEVSVPDYYKKTISEDGLTVTNTLVEFSIGLKKIDKRSGALLDGAKFLLTRDGVEREVDVTGGYIDLDNLPAGTYNLKELVAPDGYKLNNKEYTIVISPNGDVSLDGELIEANEEGVKIIVIENKSKTRLPDTGGPGTIVFIILGMSLMSISYIGYKRRYN